MSATAPRRTVPAVMLAVFAASIAVALVASVATDDGAAASPTTTAVTSTTRATPTTTNRAAGTTAVPTTTEAGPAPSGSRRVAPRVDIEKIRPTSLPVRTLVLVTAIVIAMLATAGFIYGKLRSRPPGAPARRPAVAADAPTAVTDTTPVGSPPVLAPPPTPLPPPRPQAFPPPEAVSEWAPPKG